MIFAYVICVIDLLWTDDENYENNSKVSLCLFGLSCKATVPLIKCLLRGKLLTITNRNTGSHNKSTGNLSSALKKLPFHLIPMFIPM